MSQAIKVPKAASLVANRVRRRIVLGELEPGTALPNETALMAQYEVSRPTLREALRILEAESLISVKRGAQGGARVMQPPPTVVAHLASTVLRMRKTTVGDLFVARGIIEPAAVELLVERARENPAVLDPLWALHEDSIAAKDNIQRYGTIAARFHEQVIELSGNETLRLIGLMLLEMVETHNEPILKGSLQIAPTVMETAEADHFEFLRMLERGDVETVDFWRRHVTEAAEMAFASLGKDSLLSYVEADV